VPKGIRLVTQTTHDADTNEFAAFRAIRITTEKGFNGANGHKTDTANRARAPPRRVGIWPPRFRLWPTGALADRARFLYSRLHFPSTRNEQTFSFSQGGRASVPPAHLARCSRTSA